MVIRYIKNGKKYKIKRSNRDVRVIVYQDAEHVKIKIRAISDDITLIEAKETIPFNVNFKDLYFLNGYQSWTDTKEFKLVKRLRDVKKSPHLIVHQYGMDKYGDSTFYKYSIKKSHGYDIFYSKGEFESFIYNLNYQTAYLLVELIKDRKDIFLTSMLKGLSVKKGEEVVIFDYCYFDSFEEGLASFKKAFPRLENKEKIFGYTSWYNYYQNINEEIILRDLEALDDRFNVFQIDDGFETFVGDWLDVDPQKFPNGLEPIVKRIHEKGYKAGLWLAPFAVEKKSKVFQEHPDWIKKDKKGHPAQCGGNWSGIYSLDFDNLEAMAYMKKCLEHYANMGFDFFKLDFMYCVALYDYDDKTRCQIQDRAYKLIRNILKDKLILGCGANIINSYQKFDYLRIGPDVSLQFDDVAYMRLFHRERPSTKVTIQNTISRSIFDHHLFLNDPDVFLLRDYNIRLSFAQRVALTKINALFGSVLMTSDDLSTYDDTKKKILSDALELFKNGEVISYETRGDKIVVNYLLNKEAHQFTYDTNKGVLINER